jgi:serine/threonine protein kinase
MGAGRAKLIDGGSAEDEEVVRWRAPKVIKGESGADTEAALVYSMGMLMLEVLTCRLPCAEMDLADVKHLSLAKGDAVEVKGSGPLFDIVRSCVMLSPGARPSLDSLLCSLARLVPGMDVLQDDRVPDVAVALEDKNLDPAQNAGEEASAQEKKDGNSPNDDRIILSPSRTVFIF